jgi:hypothetical protein
MTDPEDHALAAQQAAEDHIAACWAYLHDDAPEPETAAPFCGCLVCEVRETLHAATPHLYRMWEADRG